MDNKTKLVKILDTTVKKNCFNKILKLHAIAKNPDIITKKANYLFILSHMRSRSSVLAHLLGSNQSILGYTELHKSYLRKKDLLSMKAYLHMEEDIEKTKPKYYLDKILHNKHAISPGILTHRNTYVIFLLREPISTLKSTINMGKINNSKNRIPEIALKIYTERLSELQEYAKIADKNYAVIFSESIINKTELCLDSLSNWLNLPQKITRQYKVYSKTGKPVYGDPSEYIKCGYITDTKNYSNIKLSPLIEKKANESYENCKHILTRNAKMKNLTIV